MANTTGKKFGGRKKGQQNALTTNFKNLLSDVIRRMNADDSKPYTLYNWGKANPDKFYPIASKLIPTELTGTLKESLTVEFKPLDEEPS